MKKTLSILFVGIFALVVLSFCGCDFLFGDDERLLEIKVVSNDETLGTVIGGGRYKAYQDVTLRATPAEGCRLVRWSNFDGATLSQTIVVREETTITAYFERIPEPTAITFISLPTYFYWGEQDVFDTNLNVTITYDTGDQETVLLANLQITGVSTENVGTRTMTVSYKEFTYERNYSVVYADIDISNVVFKNAYLLDDKMEISGYVVAKGKNDKAQNIAVTDERIVISGFDTSTVTHEANSSTLSTRELTLKLAGSTHKKTLEYSVWYDDFDTISGEEKDISSKYAVKLNVFSLEINNRFTIDLSKIEKDAIGNLNLSDGVFERQGAKYYTWAQNEKDPHVIDLFYQSGAFESSIKQIGYVEVRPTETVVVFFKEIFNDGLIKFTPSTDVTFLLNAR